MNSEQVEGLNKVPIRNGKATDAHTSRIRGEIRKWQVSRYIQASNIGLSVPSFLRQNTLESIAKSYKGL